MRWGEVRCTGVGGRRVRRAQARVVGRGHVRTVGAGRAAGGVRASTYRFPRLDVGARLDRPLHATQVARFHRALQLLIVGVGHLHVADLRPTRTSEPGARTTGSFDAGRSPHSSALTGSPCPRRTTEDIWIWAVPRPRSGHSALTSSLARCALPCALGLPCSCTRPPDPLAVERRAWGWCGGAAPRPGWRIVLSANCPARFATETGCRGHF